MRFTPCRKIGMGVLGALVSVLLGGAPAGAQIPGLTGTSFSLVATNGYIQNTDGNNLFFWGFADGSADQLTSQEFQKIFTAPVKNRGCLRLLLSVRFYS